MWKNGGGKEEEKGKKKETEKEKAALVAAQFRVKTLLGLVDMIVFVERMRRFRVMIIEARWL